VRTAGRGWSGRERARNGRKGFVLGGFRAFGGCWRDGWAEGLERENNGVHGAFVCGLWRGEVWGCDGWFGEVSGLLFLWSKMWIFWKGVTIGVTERGYIFERKGLQIPDFTLRMERGCKYGFSEIGILFTLDSPPSISTPFLRYTLLYIVGNGGFKGLFGRVAAVLWAAREGVNTAEG